MSDIEKSFSYLQDNIPQWLQDIVRVEEKVTVMQDDSTESSVSQLPFAQRRSDSIESIRPDRLGATAEEVPPSNGVHTDSVASRKRKTLSVHSGRFSGPSRYRPRRMVVVSYDGDVQKAFEVLVRAIGAGRNILRKAKMEAKMNEMAALAESSDDDDVDGEEEEAIPSRNNYRPRMSSMRARSAARRSGRLGVSSGSNTPAELFETTDKKLEQAQELCEKAAHLTLREGDCRKELEDVRKNFETILETAKSEVTKCNVRRSQELPELRAQDTSDTSVSSIEPEASYENHIPQTSLPAPEAEAQPKIAAIGPTASAPTPPKIVDIEVDDDDETGEEDFVMPPVRLTSRLHGRG
ncbi:hypothetical protein EJ02DRAFT_452468 [Clathrospora elynae]|uniref:Uncharacterized protein n=1 Tax=Clathrospora elynae TaxID=706981 RepID=A0A6A5SV44_9PLEO|nr:hypothetical protein EJ02DRAFT_452468 [Clathrospora elynae]